MVFSSLTGYFFVQCFTVLSHITMFADISLLEFLSLTCAHMASILRSFLGFISVWNGWKGNMIIKHTPKWNVRWQTSTPCEGRDTGLANRVELRDGSYCLTWATRGKSFPIFKDGNDWERLKRVWQWAMAHDSPHPVLLLALYYGFMDVHTIKEAWSFNPLTVGILLRA